MTCVQTDESDEDKFLQHPPAHIHNTERLESTKRQHV